MGYVFSKATLWILLALIVGALIGYFWNGWRRSKWVDSSSTASAVSGSTGANNDETERLRHRVANLEPVVAERDELKGRVGDLEAELRACRASLAAAPAAAVAPAAVQGFADVGAAAEPVNRFADVTYDVERGAQVLGEKVVVDDLKLVEGIGPKIADLCHDNGIHTWAALADTSVERLREVVQPLNATGVHKPDTWPRQAELLALGKWEEFKELIDRLTAGRE
jgi:predicted flap endonuclease-1-like 5' DNA nuclease